MLQEEKIIIGQHRIPAGTNEITQVKELLDAIDLVNCVVTADAAHAHRGAEPDYADLDCSHGRIILRSIWVTDAAGIDFPHADQVYRIRRDAYDIAGTYLSKEIVHGITGLDARRGTPRSSPRSPGASGALNRCTSCVLQGRDTAPSLAGRPEHRLRRERPPGHGVPAEHRGQPAAYRRGHRDPPDPPGNLP